MTNKKTTNQVNTRLARSRDGAIGKIYSTIKKRLKFFRKPLESIRKINLWLISIIFYIATFALVLLSMGLLQNITQNIFRILAVVFYVFLLSFISVFHLHKYNILIARQPRKLFTFCLINFSILLIARGILYANISEYAIPATLAGMLLASFVNGHTALVCIIMLGGLIGFISNFRIDIVLNFMIMGTVASLAMSLIKKQKDLFKIGIATGIMGAVFITSWGFLHQWTAEKISIQCLYVIGSALISSFLALEILPFLENFSGKITNAKLIELLHLNHPLLMNLREKAPGSYQSCLMVANLAEAAAEKVNANSLLAKIGAYYHDIGKVKNPPYFVENLSLNSKSKHEKVNPALSSLILISHVKEGVQLANKYKLPKEIRDIIQQHHGTTFTSFFYQEALKKDSNGMVKEESFRYPGPKPQSKEAAIVMLADIVEAASRTLEDPSPTRIRNLVENLIKEKLTARQLDESQLNLNDLDAIQKSFIQTLTGTFHSRIKYPSSEQINGQKDATDKGNHSNTKK